MALQPDSLHSHWNISQREHLDPLHRNKRTPRSNWLSSAGEPGYGGARISRRSRFLIQTSDSDGPVNMPLIFPSVAAEWSELSDAAVQEVTRGHVMRGVT